MTQRRCDADRDLASAPVTHPDGPIGTSTFRAARGLAWRPSRWQSAQTSSRRCPSLTSTGVEASRRFYVDGSGRRSDDQPTGHQSGHAVLGRDELRLGDAAMDALRSLWRDWPHRAGARAPAPLGKAASVCLKVIATEPGELAIAQFGIPDRTGASQIKRPSVSNGSVDHVSAITRALNMRRRAGRHTATHLPEAGEPVRRASSDDQCSGGTCGPQAASSA